MLQTCHCGSCKKPLSCSVEGFDGKNLWITLKFDRRYEMCNECKHMKNSEMSIWFCSVQCLKDYVMDPECLDQFVEDEIFWGKYKGA